MTLLTAYFYLGIIFDRFPRHPVITLPNELNDIGEVGREGGRPAAAAWTPLLACVPL